MNARHGWAAVAISMIANTGPSVAAPGSYSLVELLARDSVQSELKSHDIPIELIKPRLEQDPEDGWTAGFSDRWHSSEAFPGEFLKEFEDGLSWFLKAKGFELGAAQDGIQVRVSFTGFEGRKRVHNDGGDLKGRLEILQGSTLVLERVLFSTLTYMDESDETKAFSARLGLQRVPFDTVLFYRLSRAFYEDISAALLEAPAALEESRRRAEEEQEVEVDQPRAEQSAPTTRRPVGYLTIESIPDLAEIFINGSLLATTPAREVLLPVGEHSITLRKSGYEDWVRKVIVIEGNRLTMKAELRARED